MTTEQPSPSNHLPPLLEDLTNRQLVGMALLAVFSKDPKLLHLATIPDFEELLLLLHIYQGKLFHVPPQTIQKHLRDLVAAAQLVYQGNISKAAAGRLFRVKAPDIALILKNATPPLEAFKEFSRLRTQRENMRNYRARARKKPALPFHARFTPSDK